MSSPERRPRTLTLLSVVFLGAGLFQALGVYAAVIGWDLLTSLPLALPPAYLLIRNGLLATLFIALSVALWRRRRWGARLGLLGLPVAAAWGPLERLWFARSDFGDTSLPWTIFSSAIWLGVALWILWRSRKALN